MRSGWWVAQQPTQDDKNRRPKSSKIEIKTKKKKKPKPKRSENWSALIRFWGMTNAFEIRIGDLIASQTNGLKCDDNKLIS